MDPLFVVSIRPKRYFLTKEIGYWLAAKGIDYKYTEEDELLATVPAEHMAQLGILATLIVKNEPVTRSQSGSGEASPTAN